MRRKKGREIMIKREIIEREITKMTSKLNNRNKIAKSQRN